MELAELLQGRVQGPAHAHELPVRASLIWQCPGRARQLPTLRRHHVILSLEAQDLWSITHKMTGFNNCSGWNRNPASSRARRSSPVSVIDLNHKSNYQDFGPIRGSRPGDHRRRRSHAARGLIEAVEADHAGSPTPASFGTRRQDRREMNQAARESNRELAAVAWDASPISTARLSAEMWAQIKNEDWSLVSNDRMVSSWPTRLWSFNKHYQFIGAQGGAGIGYPGLPAAVGAALANKKHGRLSVSIQCDGDLNYAPGVLWTAAHHKIPLLTVMHNNRAYHEERMYLALLGAKYDRDLGRSDIGTALNGPNIDYASIAKGYGLYAEGRITDPKDLGPALKRAIARREGRRDLALLDVVPQPR